MIESWWTAGMIGLDDNYIWFVIVLGYGFGGFSFYIWDMTIVVALGENHSVNIKKFIDRIQYKILTLT